MLKRKDIIGQVSHCSKCGKQLRERKRKPCPKCGSLARTHTRETMDTTGANDRAG